MKFFNINEISMIRLTALSTMLTALLLLANCTGASPQVTFGAAGNTNPAKPYGSWMVAGKGGMIYHGASVPGQIAASPVEGEIKISRACSHSVLFLVSWGDSSIFKAVQKENIEKIQSVQHDIMALWAGYLYHRHCTVLRGVAGGEISKPVISGELLKAEEQIKKEAQETSNEDDF